MSRRDRSEDATGPEPGRSFDCIVVGTGGVGSAACDHLARRGARVLGLDRFPPGHDRGSSHGDTRIIRQAYFEHPDYVPMLLRAYELWQDLSLRTGKKLYHEVGIIEVGPPSGIVISGVLEAARAHGLPLERVSNAEAATRFPGLSIPDDMEVLFERRAGYLRVEECVVAHCEEAVKNGAVLQHGEVVRRWAPDGRGVRVETDQRTYRAQSLILTAGAWAGQLLGDLGLALEVLRMPLVWYATRGDGYREENGFPTFLFETAAGRFYGFPQIDGHGIKIARHTDTRSAGHTKQREVVADPLALDRSLRPGDREPVEAFLAAHCPQVRSECVRHAVCMYTMTPDEHFAVGLHPDYPAVALAAGLSGHGFKFTGVLGEALADLVLEGQTSLPIGFLGLERKGLRN